MIEDSIQTILGTTDPLTLKLRGGFVSRYHAEHIGIRQDVSQHTWRMIVILHHLWPNSSRELLLAALFHDVAEGYTGDLPAPTKRALPGLKAAEDEYEKYLGIDFELADRERACLKCADYLELTLSVVQLPISMRVAQIVETAKGYVTEIAASLPAEECYRVMSLLTDILKGKTYD